jgi:hypothetical protein
VVVAAGTEETTVATFETLPRFDRRRLYGSACPAGVRRARTVQTAAVGFADSAVRR